MFYLINSISFEMYILLLLFLFFGSIFSIFDTKKKRPGHPSIWIFPFSMFMSVALIVFRIAVDLTTNIMLQQISEIIAIISIIAFFLSFFITFVIAYKKDYVNKDKVKKLFPLLITTIIFVVVCVLIFGFINN